MPLLRLKPSWSVWVLFIGLALASSTVGAASFSQRLKLLPALVLDLRRHSLVRGWNGSVFLLPCELRCVTAPLSALVNPATALAFDFEFVWSLR